MTLFSGKHKVANKVYLIPVSQIAANPAQPRRRFEDESIRSLAASIAESGLLQPISVRKINEDLFELIAGERRLRACVKNGMTEIPAIVEEMNSKDSAVIALIENLQRCDLNFFEEATAYVMLMEGWGVTQEELARRLGRSQSGISNKLRLLKLDYRIRDKILGAGLTERHARALLQIEDMATQEKIVEVILARCMNVSQTEGYIAQLVNKKKPQGKKPVYYVKDIRLFYNTINKAIHIMNQGGIQAISETTEDDEYIEYKVRIPKKAAYKKPAATATA